MNAFTIGSLAIACALAMAIKAAAEESTMEKDETVICKVSDSVKEDSIKNKETSRASATTFCVQ